MPQLRNKASESWGWHDEWKFDGLWMFVKRCSLSRLAVLLSSSHKSKAALKTNSREGGNLPEWGIDFVWPRRVLHSRSWQQESSETCFTNRRAKAPVQNYFLTARSCAPPFFVSFFTDDTILSGHSSHLKLQRCKMPPSSLCMQGETYTLLELTAHGRGRDFIHVKLLTLPANCAAHWWLIPHALKQVLIPGDYSER